MRDKRRLLIRVSRALGLALVVAFVVWQWDRVALAGDLLLSGDPIAWLCASLLQFVCLAIASLRFAFLLKAVGHKSRFSVVYLDLLCATALNAALLMGVGDLYRIRRTERIVDSFALSGALIIVDRILGFSVICAILGIVSLALGSSAYHVEPSTFALVIVGGIVCVGILALVITRRSRGIWQELQRPFVAIIARPKIGAAALVSSFLLSGVWLVSIVVVARGIGIEAPTSAIVLAASIVTMASVLPISVGGIGVREAGYALLLGSYGVSASSAIALGIAQYALLLPVMVAGAIAGALRIRQNAPSSGDEDTDNSLE